MSVGKEQAAANRKSSVFTVVYLVHGKSHRQFLFACYCTTKVYDKFPQL